MQDIRTANVFRRADEWELAHCLRFMAWCRKMDYIGFFRIISRLGDGVVWYTLLIGVALNNFKAGVCLAIAGVLFTSTYKLLKRTLVRERPFITHPSIHSEAPVLDRYSFPSGHTLHAVGFTALLGVEYPLLALAALPFTILVALSRVALGLHYPSDVFAGAIGGLLLACFAFVFLPFTG